MFLSQFESNLLQAFAKNHVQTIVDIFATEKKFKSFADRLDKVVDKVGLFINNAFGLHSMNQDK